MIIPAHSIEATAMAQNLLLEWQAHAFPVHANFDDNDTPPTEAIVREFMAISFGFDDWSALIAAVSQPHTPLYLDDDEVALTRITHALSLQVGYDYPHGIVKSMIQNSGCGYSPQYQRQLAANASPWGQITARKMVATGIEQVTTESHGGYRLSPARMQAMPPHLALEDEWYEQDCEAALVQLAFPEDFISALPYALASVDIIDSGTIPYVREKSRPPRQSRLFPTRAPNRAPNRELNEDEKHIIDYLAHCVRLNRQPIRQPPTPRSALADWIAILPTTRSNRIITGVKWRSHFQVMPEYFDVD